MVDYLAWLDANWFNLLQAGGIIGTLTFTGVGIHREAKAREVENLLQLARHHQELWAGFAGRKNLERVLHPELDLKAAPPSTAESDFLNRVIVHYQTGWRVASAGGITSLAEMEEDVRGFFSLPLPRAVWEQTKKYRNRKFVRFVDKAMG